MAYIDYYKILGVDKRASQDDISNHSIFRLDTHRNPAYLCAITNY